MIDHPYISDPTYTTTVMAWDEGLTFFQAVSHEGIVLMDTYYLSYVLTMVIALFTILRAKHDGVPNTGWYERLSCVIHVTAGALLGARVFYALVYNFSLFWENPSLWLGGSGMSTHGALLGSLLGAWIWSRRFRYPFRRLLDNGAYPIAYGTFLGRIANFLNGELYGRSASPDLPWAMRFPMRDGQGNDLVVNASGELYSEIVRISDTGAREVWAEPAALEQGYQSAVDSVPYELPIGSADGSARDFFYQAITDPRHPSQLYQALSDGLLLLVVLLILSRFIKTPGARAAWALIGYGASRFCMEFFRQPDPQMGYFLGIFSTGQLLSLTLVTLGALWLRWLIKHPLPKVAAADLDSGTAPTTEESGNQADPKAP